MRSEDLRILLFLPPDIVISHWLYPALMHSILFCLQFIKRFILSVWWSHSNIQALFRNFAEFYGTTSSNTHSHVTSPATIHPPLSSEIIAPPPPTIHLPPRPRALASTRFVASYRTLKPVVPPVEVCYGGNSLCGSCRL